MATVVDAARVTTPDNTAFAERHARSGWELAQQYAGLLGRIEAWALLIPDVSDAQRLDHIRHALAGLHRIHQGKEVE